MKRKNDQELLQKIKHSDLDAFHIIFTKYHSTLFRLVYSRVNDFDLARDITQDTFIRV